MKKTLKEIFEPYQIYNDKGELIPLLQTELGKELFGEVNELNKSDVKKSVGENEEKCDCGRKMVLTYYCNYCDSDT